MYLKKCFHTIHVSSFLQSGPNRCHNFTESWSKFSAARFFKVVNQQYKLCRQLGEPPAREDELLLLMLHLFRQKFEAFYVKNSN
jgi:hypothetical protein